MNRSLHARRISLASLLALALVGCRAAPTGCAPSPSQSTAKAEPLASVNEAGPKLEYLRTEAVALHLYGSGPETDYYDFFELRNPTSQPIRYLHCGHISPSVCVRGVTGEWIATTNRWMLGSWPHIKILEPGQAVEVRCESWLRPSQANVAVGRLGDGDAAQWPGDFARAEYDSSLAFPDVPSPPLGGRAIEMLPPVPPELRAPSLGLDALLDGGSDR